MTYYLNGWRESLDYIMNSTNAIEVNRTETAIYFVTA
jgi:hypothetical protein